MSVANRLNLNQILEILSRSSGLTTHPEAALITAWVFNFDTTLIGLFAQCLPELLEHEDGELREACIWHCLKQLKARSLEGPTSNPGAFSGGVRVKVLSYKSAASANDAFVWRILGILAKNGFHENAAFSYPRVYRVSLAEIRSVSNVQEEQFREGMNRLQNNGFIREQGGKYELSILLPLFYDLPDPVR